MQLTISRVSSSSNKHSETHLFLLRLLEGYWGSYGSREIWEMCSDMAINVIESLPLVVNIMDK